MERIRSKSTQHKTFQETSRNLRISMLGKQYALDAVEKSNLQKCLDQMQHCIKVQLINRIDFFWHFFATKKQQFYRELGDYETRSCRTTRKSVATAGIEIYRRCDRFVHLIRHVLFGNKIGHEWDRYGC